MGSAYDRTIYAFGIESTEEQDDALIKKLNSRSNKTHFNLFFFNCADFARKAVDLYYPHAVHRSLLNDAGIMTPKQAARSLVSYRKHHKDLQFSILIIPQVEGTVPRSTAVRGVFESLAKSKRYAVPLVTIAVLHPFVGGSLAFAWIEGSRFDPRRMAPTEFVLNTGRNQKLNYSQIAFSLRDDTLFRTCGSGVDIRGVHQNLNLTVIAAVIRLSKTHCLDARIIQAEILHQVIADNHRLRLRGHTILV